MIVGHIGSGSSGGYEIQKSLRFRASASAHLSRTFSTSSLGVSFSFWIKRGAIGSAQSIFGYSNGSTESFGIGFNADNTLDFYSYSSAYIARRNTTRIFRDPSAWYHITLVVDSANVTALDRMRVYVNGVRETAFNATVNQAQNQPLNLTQGTWPRSIGRSGGTADRYFDGYLSEINFIDGQALDPSYFGEISTETGSWIPKKYAGTYGTNGFYLPYNDGTSATTLGYDFSGNANHWTTSGISTTVGTTYDWMDDTPSNNFAVLNPLNNSGTRHLISQGNLAASLSAASDDRMLHGMIFTSYGKWVFEYLFLGGASIGAVGIASNSAITSGGGVPQSNSVIYFGSGAIYKNGVNIGTFTPYTINDVIRVAYDLDALTVAFYKNNSLVTTVTGITPDAYSLGVFANQTGDNFAVNFGQRPFAYTTPAGFKALCTKNLHTGTITTSGTFSGSASTDGPFVYLNGVPTAMTINGNAVTFGNHADKLANGFKVRSSSASYNSAGSNTYSITSTGTKFKYSNAQGNP